MVGLEIIICERSEMSFKFMAWIFIESEMEIAITTLRENLLKAFFFFGACKDFAIQEEIIDGLLHFQRPRRICLPWTVSIAYIRNEFVL